MRKTPDAFASAVRLLSYRQRGTKELIGRLKKNGFADEDIESAVARLALSGYLNDAAYALELRRLRLKNKNWGSIKIIRELYAKGIPADVIEGIKKEFSGAWMDEEMEAAKAALGKWLKRKGLKKPLDRKDSLKAYAFLKSRGFPDAVLSGALGGLDEDEQYCL